MEVVPVDRKGGLTRSEFERLANIPPEEEWLANIRNDKTRRAYRRDVREFVAFSGSISFEELRSVTRAHVIAWRKDLEAGNKKGSTVRRKLSSLSSLFDYLCDKNAVAGVERPESNGNEGSTPALGDAQARRLLEAPPPKTLKGIRDRAILATLLYHGIRREELCRLKVKDLHTRQGVMHFRVHGKRDKIRFIVVSPAAQRLIEDYFVRLGHRADLEGALFRPINNNGFEALNRKRKGTALLDSAAENQRRVKNRENKGALDKHLAPASVYRHIVLKYGRQTGVSAEVIGLCVHSMRATAATNALEHGADIAKVQDMMGHANISTTRLYDRRKSKPEDSPIISDQVLKSPRTLLARHTGYISTSLRAIYQLDWSVIKGVMRGNPKANSI